MKVATAVTILRALRARIDASSIMSIGKFEMCALFACYKVTDNPDYVKLLSYGFCQMPVKTKDGGVMSVLPVADEKAYLLIHDGYKKLEASDKTIEYQMPKGKELGELVKEILKPKADDTPTLPAELKNEFAEFDASFEKLMKEATVEPPDPTKLN